MSSNVAGLLAYILGPITGVVFLLVEPYRQDNFVRFHAFQSILYGMAWGVIFSVLGVVFSLLTLLTFGLAALAHLGAMLLFAFAAFLYWLFLLFKAYSGERYMVPYIGKIAASAGDLPPASPNANAFLTYVLAFITGIIFVTQEPFKNDKFVRFHAFQSIFVSLVFIAFYFVWLILSVVLGIASLGFLFLFMGLIGRVIRLGLLSFWIFMMYKAYNNEWYKAPLIGDLAAQQAGV
jgi:uncharacterized membrane protein